MSSTAESRWCVRATRWLGLESKRVVWVSMGCFCPPCVLRMCIFARDVAANGAFTPSVSNFAFNFSSLLLVLITAPSCCSFIASHLNQHPHAPLTCLQATALLERPVLLQRLPHCCPILPPSVSWIFLVRSLPSCSTAPSYASR